MKLEEPIKIYENSSAILIAKNDNFSKNSKHIINENYVNKTINIIKIDLEEHIANILTKSLD